MPITLHTAQMKVRGNSGDNYISLDTVADATTEERIARISSELPYPGELKEMIAPTFDAASAYNAGDYVTYTDSNDVVKLYRFDTNHVAGTSWDNNEVSEVDMGSELKDNIDVANAANAAAEKAVRYDEAQTLLDSEKAVARGNIDAASMDDVTHWAITRYATMITTAERLSDVTGGTMDVNNLPSNKIIAFGPTPLLWAR